jgi:hypothetical protein
MTLPVAFMSPRRASADVRDVDAAIRFTASHCAAMGTNSVSDNIIPPMANKANRVVQAFLHNTTTNTRPWPGHVRRVRSQAIRVLASFETPLGTTWTQQDVQEIIPDVHESVASLRRREK